MAEQNIKTVTIAKARRTRNLFSAFTIKPSDIKIARQDAETGNPERYFEILDHIKTIDARLKGDLETRKLALLSFDYEVHGEDETQKAFVNTVLEDLNYQSLASALLDGVYLGMKIIETDWENIGGKLRPTTFDPMDAKYFRSAGYGLSAELDITKLNPKKLTDVLLYRDTDNKIIPFKDYPAGKLIVMDFSDISYKSLPINFTRMGLGALCMMLSLAKHYNMQDWGAFNEIFGQPMRLGIYNSQVTQPEIDKLEEVVQNLGSDAAGTISENTKIEFPSVNRADSAQTYDSFETVLNKNISFAILGETLTSDTSTNGNRSLGQVHNGVRLEKIKADAHYIEREINRQLIAPLLAYNFGKVDPTIKLIIPVKPELDLEKEARVIVDLVNVGQPITQAQVRERFQLKEPQNNEPILQKSQGGLSSLLGGAP